jgi:hypothetical protein
VKETSRSISAGDGRLSRHRPVRDRELSFMSHDQFVGVSVLIVDRFRRSRRHRRTRTGCAIMAAGPGGPGSGMSPWIVPIVADTTLTQLRKNSATTSAYGDGRMRTYSPRSWAYARRQWVDAWTAMTFPGRCLAVL